MHARKKFKSVRALMHRPDAPSDVNIERGVRMMGTVSRQANHRGLHYLPIRRRQSDDREWSMGQLRIDGTKRSRYRRRAAADAEVERLRHMLTPTPSISVDLWKSWLWAWKSLTNEYALRRQFGWPLPHMFYAQRKKRLPNPFGTAHPVLDQPTRFQMAQAHGSPTGADTSKQREEFQRR
jgi:hypothetical protein